MKFRTVRIMIAKGKARLLYTVSMLLLPLISWAQNNSGNTINTINMDDFTPVRVSSGDILLMYGAPPVSDNPSRDTIAGYDVRFGGIRVMYGPPAIPQNTAKKDIKPLVVLDGVIAECDSAVLANFDFNNQIYFSGNLAELLGIKANSIKGVRPLMQSTAMQFWGTRGANGVVEIYTKKYYRKNRSSLKGNYTKVLKGKSVLYL